jgi:hypothetical protein
VTPVCPRPGRVRLNDAICRGGCCFASFDSQQKHHNAGLLDVDLLVMDRRIGSTISGHVGAEGPLQPRFAACAPARYTAYRRQLLI